MRISKIELITVTPSFRKLFPMGRGLEQGRQECEYLREYGDWKLSSMRFVNPLPPQPDSQAAIRLKR